MKYYNFTDIAKEYGKYNSSFIIGRYNRALELYRLGVIKENIQSLCSNNNKIISKSGFKYNLVSEDNLPEFKRLIDKVKIIKFVNRKKPTSSSWTDDLKYCFSIESDCQVCRLAKIFSSIQSDCKLNTTLIKLLKKEGK